MKKNLSWYVKRLMKMSFIEIFFRIKESSLYFIDCLWFKGGWKNDGERTSVSIENIDDKLGKHLLSYKDDLINILPIPLEKSLPFDNSLFFKNVNIKNGFDLRLYWESQRFNQTILVALSSHRSENIIRILDFWMKNNPPLKGCNYISTMECAIRCINLYAALCIMKSKGFLSDELLQLSTVFFNNNYRLIKHRISKFSSRGNHTLFEYAGLAICSKALSLPKKVYWVEKCLSEFDFQTNADGSGIEQSTSYHLFNVEVAWLIQHHCCATHGFSSKLDKAIKFCSYFWQNNKIVRIGDSDSSVLFSRVFLISQLSENMAPSKPVLNNNEAGIVLLKNKDAVAYFKYGQLGLPPLYGHGHYDFLAINLINSSGEAIIADSHTYLYNCEQRKEFRSSKYHSMPTYGDDDIKQGSAFSWDKNKTGELLHCKENFISARYIRDDQVEVIRSLYSANGFFVLVDYIKGGTKEFSTNLLIKSKSVKVNFYTYSEQSGLSSIQSNTELVDFSEHYGEIEPESVNRTWVATLPKNRIVTVINLTNVAVLESEILNLIIK
ncbi:putative MSP domain-containing protein [Vibrio chagasii]|nr:putative MSP domain-containing protein [Vibrio chagasii]